MTETAADQLLFSYGALQSPEVQLDLFGRVIASAAGVITGFTVDYADVEDHRDADACDSSVHPIVRHTGNPLDKVIVTVLTVTEAELEAADEYQTPLMYRRIPVTLTDGEDGWVYVA